MALKVIFLASAANSVILIFQSLVSVDLCQSGHFLVSETVRSGSIPAFPFWKFNTGSRLESRFISINVRNVTVSPSLGVIFGLMGITGPEKKRFSK